MNLKISYLNFAFFCFLFLTVILNSYSQDEIITGTVVDSNETPIPGVNIFEDSENYNGSVTDFDGNFIIKTKPNSTIIVSYVGFITQEIQIGNEKNLKIILEEDLFGLEG